MPRLSCTLLFCRAAFAVICLSSVIYFTGASRGFEIHFVKHLNRVLVVALGRFRGCLRAELNLGWRVPQRMRMLHVILASGLSLGETNSPRTGSIVWGAGSSTASAWRSAQRGPGYGCYSLRK